MKDSADYSRKVRDLYRQLKRRHGKVQAVGYEDPIEAVIYGVLSEHLSENAAHTAFRKFKEHFVDWNDLRVSKPEEIASVMPGQLLAGRQIAIQLTGALKAIFEKYNSLNLESIKKLGKKPARQILEKLLGPSNFVIDYIMLTCLQAHAVPVTKVMIEYLKSSQLVHPEAQEQEIAAFLTRQVSAQNVYEFYALLRKCCESAENLGKEKGKARSRTKSKAASGKN